LVYDLQELFCWFVDLTVIQAFESGSLDVSDFYFAGDDHRYQFDLDAKSPYIGLLRDRFNSGVNFKGRNMKWDTVIEQKANQLGQFLTGKLPTVDFVEHIETRETGQFNGRPTLAGG
jgi:CRISPR/Cas system-associated endonuclease Cas1